MTGKSDEALDRLLKGAMRRDAQAADACPDAEMLAAFAEGTVSAQERTRVERHVSDCGRCAQALALLGETADVSATTAEGGGLSSNWWSWGAWRWLVPATTAAAVLAIWFALPDGNPGPRSDGQIALQEPTAVTPGSVEPPTPPSALVSPPTRTSVPQQQPQRSAAVPSSVSDALSKTSKADASGDAAAAPVAEAKKAAGSTESAAKQAAAPAPPAPAPPAAPAAPPALASSEAAVAPADELRQQQRESTSTARDANEAKEERADAVAQPDQGRAPAAGAGGGALSDGAPAGRGGGGRGGGRAGGGAAVASAAQQVNAFAPAQLLLRARDGSTQWRATGNTVERSTDGGATWSPDFRASTAVTAGAVAADDTVWLAGRSGLILRRGTAGWTVLTPPDRSDISGVAEVNPRSATITYADGRRFSTDDAGVTWRAR